jgi:phosphotransferase system HPr-like phosphotransfer protein
MSPRTREKKKGKSLVARYEITVERDSKGWLTATITRLDKELRITVEGKDEVNLMNAVGQTISFYVEGKGL